MNNKFIIKLVDLLLKIDKSSLEKLKILLIEDSNNKKTNVVKKHYRIKSSKINKDKKELIGNLPIILMNLDYFKTNQQLAKFAESLNLKITNWQKRSRDEIIGRIIIEVSKFDYDRIYKLNSILNKLLGKVESGKMNDFFLEWDSVIKQIK